MTIPTNPQNLFTPFLPSTYNVPEDEDRRVEWLGSTFSGITDVLNSKKIGTYTENSENFNGEEWIFDVNKVRNGYQAILRIPSFVSGVYPLPIENVNNQFAITHVWGSASLPPTTPNTGDYFSFFSEGNSNIQFTMSDLNITITAAAPMVDYSGFIVIEYLRDGI